MTGSVILYYRSVISVKLLICATEYPPYGSGIANVTYNVVERLKAQGIECTVCSPTGPDVNLGSQKLIEKTGILGMIYYWFQVSQHLKKNYYDAVWLHNPFIIDGSRFKHCLVTMHSTYCGESHHLVGIPLYLRAYKNCFKPRKILFNPHEWAYSLHWCGSAGL